MNIENVLHILHARKQWVIGTIVLVVLIAGVAVALVPRKFTALASVVVNNRGDDALRATTAQPAASGSAIATQVDIIKRPRVALRVVKALDLESDSGVRHAWQEQTGGRSDFSAWAASKVLASLSVAPAVDSNVIDIRYTSGDPSEAAKYANAFAKAYLETALELRTTPARQYTTFFDERLAELRKQLKDAQSKLSEFNKDNDIVDASGKSDVESARLSELSTQLALAQSQLADSSSRRVGAAGNVAASPEVMQNSVVQQLKGQLAAQEVKVRNLTERLGPNHPEFQRALAELSELRARVNAESSQVGSSLATASRVSTERVSELNRAVDAQRQTVLAAGQLKDQASLLQRDVDNAQRSYDLVAQRQSQTSLESQVQQSDVALLDEATVPLAHAWPNVPLTLTLALFCGALLGSVIALILEYMKPIVRSSRDLILLTELPILTMIPSAHRLTRRQWMLRGPTARLPSPPAV